MLLEDRNALVYGIGGAIGGAVACTLAREGARVFLVGRPLPLTEFPSKDDRSGGG